MVFLLKRWFLLSRQKKIKSIIGMHPIIVTKAITSLSRHFVMLVLPEHPPTLQAVCFACVVPLRSAVCLAPHGCSPVVECCVA